MSDLEGARFRATSGTAQAFGATPEQALAALRKHLKGDTDRPIVIWPYNQGDVFFTDEQQARLQALRERAPDLNAAERAELDELIAASFEATIARTNSLSFVKT